MPIRGALLLAAMAAVGSFVLLFLYSRVRQKPLPLATLIWWSIGIAYVAALLHLTLNRVTGEGRVLQWDVLAGIQDLIHRGDVRSPGYNILLFVPLGVWTSGFRVSAGKAVATGICFSVLIECLQYLFLRGVADTVDVLCNLLGTALGVALFHLWRRCKRRPA